MCFCDGASFVENGDCVRASIYFSTYEENEKYLEIVNLVSVCSYLIPNSEEKKWKSVRVVKVYFTNQLKMKHSEYFARTFRKLIYLGRLYRGSKEG